jgi:hypothetical protein
MDSKFRIKNMQAYGPCMHQTPELFTDICDKFESLHDKDIVSIGASLRKLLLNMVTLANTFDTTWVATVVYKPKTELYIFRYMAPELDVTVDFVSSCELGTKKASVIHAVNDAFYHDKISKTPISYLLANIKANTGTFEFEKKHIADEETLAVWRCTPKKTLWQKLFKNSDTVEIVDTKVVTTAL